MSVASASTGDLTAEIVLAELVRHRDELQALGVRKIGLFGSVAKGTARVDSDLDFVVEFDEFSFSKYGGLFDLLEEVFGREIDVSPLDDLKPELREHILPEVRYASFG